MAERKPIHRWFQFHCSNGSLGEHCGRLPARDMNDALELIARRLGFEEGLDWHADPDGMRMIAEGRGTQVVVRQLWSVET